ncbi:MFS transporter [Vallitalea pronyensis]|uniref:MFS transporter n=1 Tax=Vallitalea pronyensis TaxID=1348613 RepID=A0A8J8MJH0_9FIRM|nr:MFS transporter [Vallitalea pronyensis]QUI22413.1 MFS transporter [Vallitalea pronyensis]
MNNNHNIIKIYLYTLFHSFILAYVIERLFWASRGISIEQVVWIEIIYSVVVMVFELPTGMLADRFSRTTFIRIDALLAIVEFVIIIFATNFWHFALAIVLSAIGHAFQSGAHHAFIYDTLRASDKISHFEKVLGRVRAIEYLGVMISGLLGALVAAKFQYVTTYWISLGSVIVAFIITLTLKEVPKSQEQAAQPTWSKKDWSQVWTFMLSKKHIRYITLIGIMSGGVIVYLDEFWQLYMQAIDIPVIYFGIINVFGFGAVVIGSIRATSLKEKFGFHSMIRFAMTMITIGFLWLALYHHWFSIFAVMLIYFASAVIEPLIYGYLHDHAIEQYRATIESAYSLLSRLAVALIGLPFGYLATHYTIFSGFMYLAVVLTLLKMLTVVLGRKLTTQV